MVERQTRDRKVSGSSPGRSVGINISPGSTFCADSRFSIRSATYRVTAEYHVKYPNRSAKGADGRL